MKLAGKEVESVPNEVMENQGTSLLWKHQCLMLQHFGLGEISALLDHVVHRMLVGVSIQLGQPLNFEP